MASNRLALAALALACILAAAGGGYLASRQSTVPTPAAAMSQSAPAPAVQETEAVVGDAASKAPAVSESASPTASPAKNATVKREPAPPTASRARNASATNRQDATPTLERTWPSSASPSASSSSSQVAAPADPGTTQARPEDHAAQEPPRAPEPPQKTLEELVVPADSVIGLQTENRISSDTAKVEDRVEARVTRDVKVGDQVAIPAGARAIGSVTQVEHGGKFKERARLGIRFETLVLADGTRLPIRTETIYRDGDAPGNAAAAKIGGGAVGGAILGAILGGAKGAAVGAGAGAGGGAAVVAAGDRSTATLPAGTPMTVRILSPVTVTVEK